MPVRNRSNDYLIDRQLQKTESMTGIAGVNTQDFALQEGMGAIVDRSKEHVGTTDRAIILLRKILLEQVALVEKGEDAEGRRSVELPASACGRSHDPQRHRMESRLRTRFRGAILKTI